MQIRPWSQWSDVSSWRHKLQGHICCYKSLHSLSSFISLIAGCTYSSIATYCCFLSLYTHLQTQLVHLRACRHVDTGVFFNLKPFALHVHLKLLQHSHICTRITHRSIKQLVHISCMSARICNTFLSAAANKHLVIWEMRWTGIDFVEQSWKTSMWHMLADQQCSL